MLAMTVADEGTSDCEMPEESVDICSVDVLSVRSEDLVETVEDCCEEAASSEVWDNVPTVCEAGAVTTDDCDGFVSLADPDDVACG